MTALISESTLVTCACCRRHVKAEALDERRRCADCGDAEPAAIEANLLTGIRRTLRRTRGGLLAGAMLGLASLSGCDGRPVAGDGGGTPDVHISDTAAPDRSRPPLPAPMYGLPPQPAPDSGTSTDSSVDSTADTRPDVPPVQPAYGLPSPQLDAGVSDDAQ